MITLEKLKIYRKYHGDGDMWNRLGTPQETSILKYTDWKLIDDLIQDIILIKNTQVSDNYKTKILSELNGNYNQEIIEYIIEIAKDIKSSSS